MTILWKCFQLSRKFRGYLPKCANFWAVRAYVNQFKTSDRRFAVEMLNHVRFFSASETRAEFERMILDLQSKYSSDNLPESSVIILPASDIGSSSKDMFHLTKAICEVHGIAFQFFDGGALELRRIVKNLPRCILVFVDDFAGSGKQFTTSITTKWGSVTSLSGITSVFMTAVVCSEAVSKLKNAGVELRFSYEHGLDERFHSLANNHKLGNGFSVLCSYARELHNMEPVGFNHMGCMVVMYRNSSNNVPLLLRGTRGQRIWHGMFPRQDQLAYADHEIKNPKSDQ